jgi:hypothetical protein
MSQKAFSCPEENKELANATSLETSVSVLHNIEKSKYWTSYFGSLCSLTAVCAVLCPRSDTVP